MNKKKRVKLFKKFSSSFFILSCAFYYMFGNLLSGSALSKNQGRFLWMAALTLIGASYLLYRKGSVRFEVGLFQYTTVAFAIFSLISALWATNSARVFERWPLLAKIIVSMFFLSMFMIDSTDIRIILKSIEYGGYFTTLFIILRFSLSGLVNMFRKGSRLNYTGVDTNLLGMVAAYSIIICFYFLIVEGFRFTSLLSLPCFFIVVLSVSKKAIFSVVFGLLLFLILRNINDKSFLRNLLRVIVIVLLSAVALYFLFKLPFMAKVSVRITRMIAGFLGGTNASDIDESTYERLSLVKSGIEIIRNHPILGVGYDNARFYNVYQLYLHNNYLELFADLGIIGLLIFYYSYIVNGIRLIRYRNTNDQEFNICATLFTLMIVLDFGRVCYYSMTAYYFIMLFCLKAKCMKAYRCNDHSLSDSTMAAIAFLLKEHNL